MNLSTAQQADRTAADAAFLQRLDDYVLADLKGVASEAISNTLRSAKWVCEWNSALGVLASRSGSFPRSLRTRLGELRMEAAQGARAARALKEHDSMSCREFVLKTVDIDFPPGLSLHEMQVVLLANILREMRNNKK